MRKLIFQINISLDGFADHTVAIADDELHDFTAAQLDNVDIVMFGRHTYRLMEGYWPNARHDPEATKSMIDFADKLNRMPKIVLSETLQKAEWNNTELIADHVTEEVARLKKKPGKDISLGGISTIQGFMRLGLVDECRILVHPVVAGHGRRLFDTIERRIDLKLLNSLTFASGVVVMHYSFNT